MHIGVDARLAGTAHGGIGRYTEELLRSLVTVGYGHRYTIFLSHRHQLPWLWEFAKKDAGKKSKVQLKIFGVKHYTVLEQLTAPLVFGREKLDLLHVPHFNVPIFYTGKMVVTIHDLLWHERKDNNATTLHPWMHTLKYSAYRFIAERAMHAAKRIFVPSEVVKRTVMQFVKEEGRIQVAHEGVSDTFSPRGKVEKRPYQYVVYTGSLYPHKNLEVVLQALQTVKDIHLIVVSGRSVFHEAFLKAVRKYKLIDRVHTEYAVQDERVTQLYRGSIAMVFPSLSEGFGLPGLEALCCGTSVIASDIPVFRELYKGLVTYFDPHQPSELIEACKKAKKGELPRLTQSQVSRLQSFYSWEKMAKETVEGYELAVS